ncbi:hypothetical protein BLNAU_14004 [Blattamonas nauphoetae]|uniref:Uncharacterized protein n=1 Tax=Blattamonas nauphoetae TaxID=2049346 RepID=A0ABQ9XF09_9EUKA|nr:hypothetical protein BLNAU_14004 [Blattamonas nauphoetae]
MDAEDVGELDGEREDVVVFSPNKKHRLLSEEQLGLFCFDKVDHTRRDLRDSRQLLPEIDLVKEADEDAVLFVFFEVLPFDGFSQPAREVGFDEERDGVVEHLDVLHLLFFLFFRHKLDSRLVQLIKLPIKLLHQQTRPHCRPSEQGPGVGDWRIALLALFF